MGHVTVLSQIPKFQRYRQTRKKKYSILFTHVSCTQPWNKLHKENEHAQTYSLVVSNYRSAYVYLVFMKQQVHRGAHAFLPDCPHIAPLQPSPTPLLFSSWSLEILSVFWVFTFHKWVRKYSIYLSMPVQDSILSGMNNTQLGRFLIFFICSSINRPLGWFHLTATENGATPTRYRFDAVIFLPVRCPVVVLLNDKLVLVWGSQKYLPLPFSVALFVYVFRNSVFPSWSISLVLSSLCQPILLGRLHLTVFWFSFL